MDTIEQNRAYAIRQTVNAYLGGTVCDTESPIGANVYAQDRYARVTDSFVTVHCMMHAIPWRWTSPDGRRIEERPRYSVSVFISERGLSVPVWSTRGELKGPACGVWSEPEDMIETALSFAIYELGEDSEYVDALETVQYVWFNDES